MGDIERMLDEATAGKFETRHCSRCKHCVVLEQPSNDRDSPLRSLFVVDTPWPIKKFRCSHPAVVEKLAVPAWAIEPDPIHLPLCAAARTPPFKGFNMFSVEQTSYPAGPCGPAAGYYEEAPVEEAKVERPLPWLERILLRFGFVREPRT